VRESRVRVELIASNDDVKVFGSGHLGHRVIFVEARQAVLIDEALLGEQAFTQAIRDYAPPSMLPEIRTWLEGRAALDNILPSS
jgi:hypothetical protein